jgi:1-phosphofructokinase family hexose kinase
MILTVTLNSAIDQVLLIDELTPGRPMLARNVVTSVGGKGLDASVVLRHLGVETVGLSFVAGENGKVLIDLLREYGIEPSPVWVDGETRLIYVLAESRTRRVSHIKHGGLQVNTQQLGQLIAVYRTYLPTSKWVICSGSLPASVPDSFCGELTRLAGEASTPFLIDSSRNAVMESIPNQPTVVKMNWEEFEWTFDVKAERLEDLIVAAREVYRKNKLKNLVLTCGMLGILAFTGQGDLRAIAPTQPVVNAAGAGDAVSGALTWRLAKGDSWADALRWAAAVAAAVVLTEGTADCRWDDVQTILPQVEIEVVSTG